MSNTELRVTDLDTDEGWGFAWEDHRGQFMLEWLPHKAERGQWQRAFRAEKQGGWSMQAMDHLEDPIDHSDARRIAIAHATGAMR